MALSFGMAPATGGGPGTAVAAAVPVGAAEAAPAPAGCAIGLPQFEQNVAESTFCVPHDVQKIGITGLR